MIICVDIDNILNDLTPKTLALYNSRTGKNIQLTDLVSYNFIECLPEEEANAIISLFKEKKLWSSLSPRAGASNGLKTLIKQGHRIYLATATDPVNFAWKVEWLKKNFSFINADNVIRIMDKSLLKTDIIIDDHLDNLVGNTAYRICLDYPWNRDERKDFIHDIHRVHNWKEIVSTVNDIERKDAEWDK